jgi:thermitase
MEDAMTTSWKPSTPARCDGLIIQVGTPGLSSDEAAAMARQVVKDRLKGKWRVELLGQNSRMFELIRIQPKTQPLVSQGWQMVADLDAHRDVVFAEVSLVIPGGDPEPRQVFPNSALKAKSFGGDSHRRCSEPDDWSLSLSSIQEAWEITPPKGKKFGEDIVVGHPDTGYTRHPEIWADARILANKGHDFESDKSDPIDPLKGKAPGHGTSTASVIMSAKDLQVPDNKNFVTGVAPLARLIPIRVSTSVVHLSFKNVAKAIYHAIENDCHVISMSLGGPLGPKYLKKAIEDAIENGIIVLAAAGNIWPFVVYPAKFDEVIAVAACNCKGKPWSGSARGTAVDLSAPGESVWRAKTAKPGKFVTKRSSGTSYAVAATVGACALWLAYHGRDNLIAQYGKPNLAAFLKKC